ncbi:hypothetical protein HK101_005544 [Irineochytrium annulatum]|nr:hypothetical protein HK101_005544 [Irineochytrium annulatum]
MSGLDRTNFGEFLGVMILQSFISVSVAIMIGTWSKSLMQAYSGLVAFGLVEFVFSGVSVNLISLNNAFLTFISQIDYWRYTVTYLLYIEFKDLVINCDVSENIPVIMDEILPSIGAQVMAVVGGVIPDKTNATLLHDHLQEWLELAALYWLAGSLSVNAATGVATVNASVLPLALPGSQAATYSASVATEIGQDIGFTLADIPIMTAGGRIVGVPANLTAQLLPAVQAYSLWKDIGTLSAQGKWFPDYSRCAVSDTLSFIEANYGIDPTLYPNVKLIAIAFFVVFTIAGYFGLHFSRRYKKR